MDLETQKARLRSLEDVFSDRLDREVLRDALDYIDYGECPLALQVLCDQLAEHRVAISENEYLTLVHMAEEWGVEHERIDFLDSLVVN